jgi:hypothetical protein
VAPVAPVGPVAPLSSYAIRMLRPFVNAAPDEEKFEIANSM